MLYCIFSTELTDVALKKQAFQNSSEYADAGAGGGVNSRQIFWSGGSCTHTRKASRNYWEVDLGEIYAVDNVKVYTRMDACCSKISDILIKTGKRLFESFSRLFLNLLILLTPHFKLICKFVDNFNTAFYVNSKLVLQSNVNKYFFQ